MSNAEKMSCTSISTYWLKTVVAYRLFVKDALLDILHDENVNGLPRDEQEAHSRLLKFREEEEVNLKTYISPSQWDTICHICVPEVCTEPCDRHNVTRTKSLDIPCIISLIITLTDLAPPLGRRGWSQATPKLGDGSKAANVLIAKQMFARLKNSSMRDIKNEEQFEEQWEEIYIILFGLCYKNMNNVYKLKAMPSLQRFSKILVKVYDERFDKLLSSSGGGYEHISKLEYETLKDSFEEFLHSVNESSIGENELTTITAMVKKQEEFERMLMDDDEKEDAEQVESGGTTGVVGNVEDNEQMLRGIIEGMKLHITGSADEIDLTQQSNDLKEACKIRFQMALQSSDPNFVDPSVIKLNLCPATDRYNNASEFSLAPESTSTMSFIQALKDQVTRLKKLNNSSQNNIVKYENIISTPTDFTIVVGLEGSGKSTLVDILLYQWGCNNMWGTSSPNLEFHFVFVLYFRQLVRFQHEPGVTAEEIITHFYPNVPLDVLVELSPEINTLLVLDGFDEFSHKNELMLKSSSEEPSFYVRAIYDLMCPKNKRLPFTRLVTTHPDGMGILSNSSVIPTTKNDKNISLNIIEASGLNFYNVNQYITKYFKDDSHPKCVLDTLKSVRFLYDTMIVPSMTRGICELVKYDLLTEDKLVESYTSLMCLMFVCHIWKHQFKGASSINGVFIKPAFKDTCINLSSIAYHLKKTRKTVFQLKDLPVESNIESLLQSGMIIKLNSNLNKPNMFCYQFQNRVFQEFLVSLHIFINGFEEKANPINNKFIFAMVGGLIGATTVESKAHFYLQKFAKLFDKQNIKLTTLLTVCNEQKSERMACLHSYIRNLREGDTKQTKNLEALLMNKKQLTVESPVDDAYDVAPATNALILFEYGFTNELVLTLDKPVAILMSALRSHMDRELRDTLKRLCAEKKLKLLGN